MKIRLQGNSLRYRLRQPEVMRFKEEGIVEEKIVLGSGPDAVLCFSLRRKGSGNITVEYSSNAVIVGVPQQVADPWSTTDQVGWEADVDMGNGIILRVLVEKDFACLDRKEEDEKEGAYPNPAKTC